MYDDDVIEVIDVETTEDSSSVSQPNKPHRKHQDGFQRSGGNIKTAFNVQADVKNEPRLPP